MHIQCVLKCFVAVRLLYIQSLLKLARTIYIQTVYEQSFWQAGKSPNTRSYTVSIYGSGQPYTLRTHNHTHTHTHTHNHTHNSHTQLTHTTHTQLTHTTHTHTTHTYTHTHTTVTWSASDKSPEVYAAAASTLLMPAAKSLATCVFVYTRAHMSM
jgi:hypothetical protein